MGDKRKKTAAGGKTPPSKGRSGRKPKTEPAPSLTPVAVEAPKEAAVVTAPPPASGAIVVPLPHHQAGGLLDLARGTVAVSAAEERVVKLLGFVLPSTVLDCDVCHRPLKLPIYQCSLVRHVACGDCGGRRCLPCAGLADAAFFVRSSYLDTLFGYFKLPCPYTKYGCASSVAYRDVAAHAAACSCAPCACPDCSFEGSPAELARHLTDEAGQHAWPVRSITYGSDQVFDIDMRELKQRDPRGATVGLYLLVAEEDDGGVFLLAVGSYSDGGHYVSVLCVRSNNADTAGPVYSSSVIVEGPPAKVRRQKMERKAVASCSMPVRFDVEEEPECNVVLVFPEDLHGTEMHLFVCIDKI
uniref:Uncharacterized protein n=1 Tax=Avena sativa TaxID=4498 RepID=A0ACD5YPA4_AVESA